MSIKQKICLQSFYIFNSTLCNKEGEEEKKILFYHPFSVDLDTKIRTIGLVEAVIKFAETFNTKDPCSSLHTQKLRQIYFQPEKNFWMVMTVNVPNLAKTKDGTEYNEYQGEEVQDSVYTAVLNMIYSMFRLNHGTFQTLLNDSGVDLLKDVFNIFFPMFLLSLKLEHCDILNIFNGIQYLPLNNITFLNVLCFVNQLERNFNSIKYTAFMYNDYLIWSGIEPNDFQSVYHYMVNILLPAHVENELHGSAISRQSGSFLSYTNQHHYCRYINIKSMSDDSSVEHIPKIYLYSTNKKELELLYLIVYRGFSSSVILFFDVLTELNSEYFKKLDAFMEPNLTKLASEIAEYCSAQHIPNLSTNLNDSSPRYVIFNNVNLAYKSIVHLDNRQNGNISISQDALKIIADIKADHLRKSDFGETIVKTLEDDWVVGKFSNSREFYVAIHHKNANLIEINEEVKKLCDAELKGIFFQT